MPPLDLQRMTSTAKQRYQTAVRTATATRSGGPDLAGLVDTLCKAVVKAHDQWRQQAFFAGLTINGPIASGGRIEGPPLDPLIRQGLPPARPGDPAVPYVEAVARGLGGAWKDFQGSVRVPDRPWYPTFAAVAAPYAPPTPNVVEPLASLSFDRSTFEPSSLAQRMHRELRTADRGAVPLFDAIAQAFSAALAEWVQRQMITNVMGKGPVPTHAPPYVPTGPVVLGDNVATPGHLAT